MKEFKLIYLLLFIVACEPRVFTISDPAMEATIPQGHKIIINKDLAPKRNDIIAFKYLSEQAGFLTFRMVAQPGDTFSIADGLCYANSLPEIPAETFQYGYIITSDLSLTDRFFEEKSIRDVIRFSSGYAAHLTVAKAEELRRVDFLKTVEKMVRERDAVNSRIFEDYSGWNEDQFEKLYIPKEGDLISGEELSRYKKTFLLHEGVDVSNRSEYHVKNSYCFVMGDNRHNALDSRYIGLIPVKNILGIVGYKGPLPSNFIFP